MDSKACLYFIKKVLSRGRGIVILNSMSKIIDHIVSRDLPYVI
jgi:hypothetical protein